MNSEIKLQTVLGIVSILLTLSMLLNLALLSSLEDASFKIMRLEKASKIGRDEKHIYEKVAIVIPSPAEQKADSHGAESVYYDVPLSHTIQDYIRERCLVYGIDMRLALAVIRTESNYDPNAISDTGDYGLMQINASNHEWLTQILGLTDYLDERENIEAGLYLLNHGFLNSDSVPKALMVYNLGLGAASECWDQGVYETIYSTMVLRNYELIEEEK